MSSGKPDIVELYGLTPTDPQVANRLVDRRCPFTQDRCTKIVRGSSNPTGVCSVTAGATRTPVVVCDNRLYGDNYAVLRAAAMEAFGVAEFLIGGGADELEEKLVDCKVPSVVAVGEGSGEPVSVMGRSKFTFDWILQHYTARRRRIGFIGVEVFTVPMGGNFRDCRDAYKDFHAGRKGIVPASEHTLAWTDIQKKFLPDVIAKGLVLSETTECYGYFVVIPEAVFQRFEDIVQGLPDQGTVGADIVSIRTYTPDQKTASGVRGVRAANYRVKDLAAAYYGRGDEKASRNLAKTLKELLQ